MADIKTRDAVKGTIKTIDKAAIATERMKSAYAKTKDKAEQGCYTDESSATEYAADRLSYGADRIKDEGIHQFNKQGQKAVKETRENIGKAKDKRLSEIRNQQIGFVFQTYNLIARTTALANVELPMLYAGMPKRERTSRAEELLQLVGMGDRMTHHSDELSGGQKQRVAIARAVANNPSIILADEPTGALDSKTGRKIMDLFHTLHHEQGKTIVLITHSQELAEETERIITLKDGVITGERKGGLAC